jgi:hypothetical protein
MDNWPSRVKAKNQLERGVPDDKACIDAQESEHFNAVSRALRYLQHGARGSPGAET